MRECAFRSKGGGSGLACDIDVYDTMENPFRQLVVWNPAERRILGGYRFLSGRDMRLVDGQPFTPSASLFRFSEAFVRDWMPETIELGRSFVTPDCRGAGQFAANAFALDNLWDGLAAVMLTNPGMKYYFGKATIYASYPLQARNILLSFLWRHFGDDSGLVTPYEPSFDTSGISHAEYDSFKSGYVEMKKAVKSCGVNIPPLVNAYMNSSPTMKIFGTALNHSFSEVHETGLMINFYEVVEGRVQHHINNFRNNRL